MERIGFYPLTIILSFLAEKDGVSLLFTKRKFAFQVLPIFRCQQQPLLSDDNTTNNDTNHTTVANTTSHRTHRLNFKVSPAQDPITLLDRLNSRRLGQRQRLQISNAIIGFSTDEIARQEWLLSTATTKMQQSQYPLPRSYSPELELLRFISMDDLSFTNSNSFAREYRDLCGCPIRTTLLVSYPRSGNTLVRSLLERTTGLVTGSDTRPDRSLSKELAEQHGLIGEGVTSSRRVKFVKTHWPERVGNQVFVGHCAIVLVRNPYDAIDSYWNMNATKSHTESLASEMYDKFRDKWHGLVRNEILIWNKFLEYWLGDECPVPVLVVRFEDLICDPRHELNRMLEFTILRNNQQPASQPPSSLSDYWLYRIQHATASSDTERLGSYQPRSASRGVASIGKSIESGHYTDELLEYIHQICATICPENYLRRFGYDLPDQGFPKNFNATNTNRSNVTRARDGRIDKRIPINEPTATSEHCLRVNEGVPVRPINCQYGRLLQQWRHSVTNNDAVPLSTTKRT
jgi:hypothetical protein